MARKTFFIKVKYADQPWVEWARTIVPAIVDHYEQGARLENPNAVVQVFVETK